MKFVKFLGMGYEGSVFVVEKNACLKVSKFLRFPLTNEARGIIDRLNESKLNFLFQINVVDVNNFEYDFIPLNPLDQSKKNLLRVLEVAKELHDNVGLLYYDLDIRRDNMMQTEDGQIYIVDYPGAFIDAEGASKLLYKLHLFNACLCLLDPAKAVNQGKINNSRTQRIYFVYTLIMVLGTALIKRFPIHWFLCDVELFFQRLYKWVVNEKN